jgi:hypothetical protein
MGDSRLQELSETDQWGAPLISSSDLAAHCPLRAPCFDLSQKQMGFAVLYRLPPWPLNYLKMGFPQELSPVFSQIKL